MRNQESGTHTEFEGSPQNQLGRRSRASATWTSRCSRFGRRGSGWMGRGPAQACAQGCAHGCSQGCAQGSAQGWAQEGARGCAQGSAQACTQGSSQGPTQGQVRSTHAWRGEAPARRVAACRSRGRWQRVTRCRRCATADPFGQEARAGRGAIAPNRQRASGPVGGWASSKWASGPVGQWSGGKWASSKWASSQVGQWQVAAFGGRPSPHRRMPRLPRGPWAVAALGQRHSGVGRPGFPIAASPPRRLSTIAISCTRIEASSSACLAA